MLRKIFLLASLPLLALPSTSLAASSTAVTPVTALVSSQPMSLPGSTSNNPVIMLSQYYPSESYDQERAEYWRRVREHRMRCEDFREYLRANHYSYNTQDLHDLWERYHHHCAGAYRGYASYRGYYP